MRDEVIETLQRTVACLEPHREALSVAWAGALQGLEPGSEDDGTVECRDELDRMFAHLSRGDLEELLANEQASARDAARRGDSFRHQALAIRALDRCCLPFLAEGLADTAALAESLLALDELADRRLELLLEAQEVESGRRLVEAQEQAASATERARALAQANDALRRAEARAEKRADQVSLLAAVARRLGGVLDPEQLLQEAADTIQAQCQYRYTAVVTLDAQGVLVGRWSGRGGLGRRSGGRAQGPPAGIIGRSIRLGAPQVVPDVSKDPDYHADVPGTRSEMVVPLLDAGRVVGALDFQSDASAGFEFDAVAAAEAIAEFVVIALRNARRFAEVRSPEPPGAASAD